MYFQGQQGNTSKEILLESENISTCFGILTNTPFQTIQTSVLLM